jgi:hypothetical protein
MNRRGATHALACIVLVLVTAGAAEARQSRDPFARGTVAAEFSFGPMVEIWNFNGRQEWLVDGTAAMWGAIGRGFCLGVEFSHLRIFQETPGAFVQGLSPLIRWRVVDRERWEVFIDAGPGLSWSDLPTPPRGTKFNYLFQSSAGVMRRVGGNSHAVMGVRFLHLSNNHREGRQHNPDLEMLGPFAGFSFSF